MTASVSIPRRVASLFLAFLTLFTLNANLLTVSASATNTKSIGIVWQDWNGGIRSRSSDFSISGNFWSKRKVTIVSDFLPNIASQGDRDQTYRKAAQFMLDHARFNVTVKDKNGRQVSSYSGLRCNSAFYLPKWSTQKYTVTVSGSFNSYNSRNTVQWNAAYFGKYHLKY